MKAAVGATWNSSGLRYLMETGSGVFVGICFVLSILLYHLNMKRMSIISARSVTAITYRMHVLEAKLLTQRIPMNKGMSIYKFNR